MQEVDSSNFCFDANVKMFDLSLRLFCWSVRHRVALVTMGIKFIKGSGVGLQTHHYSCLGAALHS